MAADKVAAKKAKDVLKYENETKKEMSPPTVPMEKKTSGAGKGRPSISRPCEEHTFLTDVAEVREMEQGLMRLREKFHSGQLQAFDDAEMFHQMDHAREQQECLARMHFELDTEQDSRNMESKQAREKANKNLEKLMTNLQDLSTSIQNLQKSQTSGK